MALTTRYLNGPGNTQLTDQVFAQEDATTGNVTWLLSDNLGTTRELVNNSSTLLGHLVHNSFGQLASGPTNLTRFLYTGQEWDADAGLQYNWHRWYDPSVGRWISQDPTGFSAGDPNLSRVVGNDPTNAVDPTGLEEWTSLRGWNPWSWPVFRWPISWATGVVAADDRAIELDQQRRRMIQNQQWNNPANLNANAYLNSMRASEAERDRMGTTAEIGVEYMAMAASSASPANLARLPAPQAQFTVGRHGAMPRPRPGQQSHHGAMSAWMRSRYSHYDPHLAPAVLMPEANHQATFGVYNTWRAQMRQRMGGTFDWSRVTEAEMRALSERIFDAAQVSASVRQQYWAEYQRMIQA